MTPRKMDLVIRRGVSFDLELIAQTKKYKYDPDVHNTAGDLARTHAENLEHHGFEYEYINFLDTYDRAELKVFKKFIKDGKEAGEPILTLDSEDEGGIELTNRSVKVQIFPYDTNEYAFDSGTYSLKLIIDEVLTPENIGSSAEPQDQIDCIIYGDLTVEGARESS